MTMSQFPNEVFLISLFCGWYLMLINYIGIVLARFHHELGGKVVKCLLHTTIPLKLLVQIQLGCKLFSSHFGINHLTSGRPPTLRSLSEVAFDLGFELWPPFCQISNLRTMAVAPSWPLASRELIYTLWPFSVKLGFEFCEELTLRWR